MSNNEWESVSERDFEAILVKAVSDFPPDDIVEYVTPWRKSMNRVLIGIALCTITLNLWCLDYFLPAVGMVLSLLGFRPLRRENKWFKNCYVITLIRAAYFFPMLILNTTIIQSTVFTVPVTSVLTAANLLLLFVEFLCLWQGLRAVQKKVNLPPRAGGAVALIIWYALMCVLAVIRYNGLVIAVAMVIGYIFIIRNIHKLSKELDEAGYSIQTVSIKVTDRCIVLILLSVLIIGGAFGYFFGGSYPMDWSTVDLSEHTEVEVIKKHLIELGFPEYVLNDLTPEDIEACDGALQVVVDITDEPVNNGRTVTSYYGNEENHQIEESTVYDVKELRITGVGVQMPGERERWMIFHHFLWTTDPGFYGTESIQLWPVYRDISEGWASDGEVSGRVLYDNDGETFAAPYYYLGNQTFTSSSIFWGEQTSTDVFATFSMPRQGEDYRGYVAYPIEEIQDDYIISSWINYTHQRSWLQYPAMTAMEKRMTDSWNDAGSFITVQDALQFYPTKEGVEMIE
ncbi:MAG: DUF948 domain-containing protein [Emergencia sp.]